MRKLKMLAIASIVALGSTIAVAAPSSMGHNMNQGHGYNNSGYHNTMGKHHKGNWISQNRHGMGPGFGMFTGLNLTPEQQQKIQVIYYEGQAKLAAMNTPSASDMNTYHNIITSDKFDEAQIRSQLEANSKTQIDRRVEMAKIHYNMYQVLTAEQKAQLKTNYDSRMANFNQRMNNAGATGMGMNHMSGHNTPCPMMP